VHSSCVSARASRTKRPPCSSGTSRAAPPASDLFGKRGRQWLTKLQLPLDERDTVAACLRQIDFLTVEIAGVDENLAKHALNRTQIRRLMTIPGWQR
jgi:transposase